MVRVAVLSSTAAKNAVCPLTFTANPNEPPCAGSTLSCLTNWPCWVNSTISLGWFGSELITSLLEFEATADGTKDTDVNLYVYDATGKEVGKDESPGPKCSVKVTPEKDGKYKFVIKNAGGNNSVTFEVKVAN